MLRNANDHYAKNGNGNAEEGGDLWQGADLMISPDARISANETVNTNTAGDQGDAHLAALAGGGYVIVWHNDDGSISAQIYDAAGAASGGELSLVGSGATGPVDVAGLSSGGFAIVWEASGSASTQVLGASFDSTGGALLPAFAIASQDVDPTDPAYAGSPANPSIAAWGSDGFAITFDGSADSGTRFVYSNGSIASRTVFLGDGTGGDADIAAFDDGSIVAVAENGAGSIDWVIVDADANAPTLSGTLPIAGTGSQARPAVATFSDGGFVIVWQDGDSSTGYMLTVQRFNADGTLDGAAVGVDTSGGGSDTGAAVTVMADDSYVITWVDALSPDAVQAQQFDATGARVGTSTEIAAGAGVGEPDVAALGNGDVVIVWSAPATDGTDILASTISFASNSDPTVSAAVIVSASEDDGTILVDLLAGANDADGDPLSVEGRQLTSAAGSDAGVTIDPDGNGLSIDASAYDSLKVGESATISYSYTIDDGNGGSVAQTATITITGVNDAPELGQSPVEFDVSEDAGATSSDLLQSATDPDGDTLDVENLALVSGNDAGITFDEATDRIDYDLSQYQYLAAGESAQIVYAYDVTDGNGGVTGQTAIVTIMGANDAPLVSGDVTANVTDNDADTSVDLLANASDPDTSDTLAVDADTVLLDPSVNTGDAGGLSFDAANGTVDVDTGYYDYLREGESEVVTFDYDLIDGNGGRISTSVTITVAGANDAPIVDAPVFETYLENDIGSSLDLLAGSSDVEDDPLAVIDLAVTSGDGGGFSQNGTQLDFDPAYYDYLAAGEEAVIAFSYTIDDGNGGGVLQSATVTVVGENDDPTLVGALSADISEDDAPVVIDLLAGASDVDEGDVLSGSDVSVSGGNSAGLSLDGNSVQVNTGAYQYLGAGESEIVTYSYTIEDGNGGSVAQSATITILGANDAPVIVDDRIAAEEGASGSGNLLANDSDVDGDELTVASIDGVSAGDVVVGTYGTLTFAADGSYIYTVGAEAVAGAPAGSVLVDTFEVIVSDGEASGVSTLTVDVLAVDGGTDGSDTASGGNGADILRGFGGNDLLDGRNGDDDIDGGNGDDVVRGGNGNDLLAGGEGQDDVDGGNGDDRIDGGAGDDRVDGGNGDDDLSGGAGDDRLFGGNGDDRLEGGAGADSYFGGNGADTFVIDTMGGEGEIDTLIDFSAMQGDRILVEGGGTLSFEQAGENVHILVDGTVVAIVLTDDVATVSGGTSDGGPVASSLPTPTDFIEAAPMMMIAPDSAFLM